MKLNAIFYTIIISIVFFATQISFATELQTELRESSPVLHYQVVEDNLGITAHGDIDIDLQCTNDGLVVPSGCGVNYSPTLKPNIEMLEPTLLKAEIQGNCCLITLGEITYKRLDPGSGNVIVKEDFYLGQELKKCCMNPPDAPKTDSSTFEGGIISNCEKVDVSSNCSIKKLVCKENIPPSVRAKLTLTDLKVVNENPPQDDPIKEGICVAIINAWSHDFSKRGREGILQLNGEFQNIQDKEDDWVTLEGEAIGGSKFGPLEDWSSNGNAIDPKPDGWRPITPDNTTKLFLSLGINLSKAKGETVYLPSSATIAVDKADLVELSSFKVIPNIGKGKNVINLNWVSGTERYNIGYRIWRGVKSNTDGYEPILLKQFGEIKSIKPELNESCSTKIQGQLKAANSNQDSKLISAIGTSVKSTCYSFTDISNLGNGTYYYLLEDIGDNGKGTFHCNQIDAVTIGQGPAIDLESAINYCKEVTGSNN